MRVIQADEIEKNLKSDTEENFITFTTDKEALVSLIDIISWMMPSVEQHNIFELLLFPPYGFGGLAHISKISSSGFSSLKQLIIEKIENKLNKKFSSIKEENNKIIYLDGRGLYTNVLYSKNIFLFYSRWWIDKNLTGDDMISIIKESLEEIFEN